MFNVMYEIPEFKLIPFTKNMANNQVTGIKSNYFYWWLDQEVNKHNSHGLFPKTKKEMNEYLDSLEDSKDLILAIIIGDKHIGNATIQRIDWVNKSGEFAIIIGEKEYWGKGIAYKVLDILLYHSFRKLNLYRIWSGTAATNIGMQKVFNKSGFKKEGEFRQATYINGKYEDIYEYSLLKDEYNSKMDYDNLKEI